MSVNSEDHVLGLWIGGGVTPTALKELADAIEYHLELHHEHHTPADGPWYMDPKVRVELTDMANACHAQLSKLPKRSWRDIF